MSGDGWEAGTAAVLAAMSRAFPAEAARAAAALDRVLRPLRGVDVPRWSVLAGGAPVEFVWRGEPGVFWTAELAGPDMADRSRLGLAIARMEVLGLPPPARRLIDRAAAWQAEGRLEWGAWLGGRHRPSGDGGKIYVEIPQGADASLLPPPLRELWPEGGSWRLAGLSADGIELYFRLDALPPHVLYRAAKAAGATDRIPELARRFGALRGLGAENAFDGRKLGMSLAIGPDNGVEGVAVFIGGNRAGGAGLAATLDAAAAGDPLIALWREGRVRTGMIGCGLSRHGTALQIGFAPLPARLAVEEAVPAPSEPA